MLSPTLRKSVTDLSRRRARAAFTVATLALAVASFSFFAIPTLIDASMQDEVRADRLADAVVTMRALTLTAEQLDEVAALPNVEAVEPRTDVDTRVLVGERRADALVVGVRDFADQHVGLVRVESGAAPRPGELLTDVQNANVGVFDGETGDTVVVVASGSTNALRFRISGVARNVDGGEVVQDQESIVLYAPEATIVALGGDPGYTRLGLRLRDPSPAAAENTVAVVRRWLTEQPGFAGFATLPSVRAPGEWPGKDETEKFAQLLSAITLLALLSALVLVSNTMTTLIAEQTGEIGIMRAVGARRRQVAVVYLRTALFLGALGALVGGAVGVVLANALAGFFGQEFWAVDVAFGVDWTVLAVSVVAGLTMPALAALPAIRRGVRADVREALESSGSAVGGREAGDRLLRRAGFLPRAAQIGLRNVGRRRRRSLATASIVALAVGNLLAIQGLSTGVAEATRGAWDEHLEDVRVWTTGRVRFDERAEQVIRSTPGVAEAQPALVNDASLAGREAFVWGVPRETLLDYRIEDGRWFTAAEEAGRERVAVIEQNLAELAGVEVGEQVTLATAAGPARVRVVGIADNLQEDGTVLFVPLPTLRAALDEPTGVSTWWVRASSRDERAIDRMMTLLQDRLTLLGYEVGGEITYVEKRDEVAENESLTTTVAVLGFVVVAISMVGLANAITTSVLERTREVGVLRCIGARARDVRRVFATEALALALAGWLVGIPLGWLLNRLLVRLVWEIVEVHVPAAFPPGNILIALAGTILLALVITLLPVRRAVRLRAGDALRYA